MYNGQEQIHWGIIEGKSLKEYLAADLIASMYTQEQREEMREVTIEEFQYGDSVIFPREYNDWKYNRENYKKAIERWTNETDENCASHAELDFLRDTRNVNEGIALYNRLIPIYQLLLGKAQTWIVSAEDAPNGMSFVEANKLRLNTIEDLQTKIANARMNKPVLNPDAKPYSATEKRHNIIEYLQSKLRDVETRISRWDKERQDILDLIEMIPD